MTTVQLFRQPDTDLTKACPAYKRAIEEFNRATIRGNAKAASEAWARADLAADAFRQGAEFARAAGGRG